MGSLDMGAGQGYEKAGRIAEVFDAVSTNYDIMFLVIF